MNNAVNLSKGPVQQQVQPQIVTDCEERKDEVSKLV